MVDASQAFAQSDYYNAAGRIAVILPKCVRARSHPWLEELYVDQKELEIENGCGENRPLSTVEPNTYVMMLYRPLYGTRYAHMRWYTELASKIDSSQISR